MMKKITRNSLVDQNDDYFNRDMEMSRNTIEEDVKVKNRHKNKRKKLKK